MAYLSPKIAVPASTGAGTYAPGPGVDVSMFESFTIASDGIAPWPTGGNWIAYWFLDPADSTSNNYTVAGTVNFNAGSIFQNFNLPDGTVNAKGRFRSIRMFCSAYTGPGVPIFWLVGRYL